MNNTFIVTPHKDDWCHCCGRRQESLADVWYPNNAEHEYKNSRYIRICSPCAGLIFMIADGPPEAEGATTAPGKFRRRDEQCIELIPKASCSDLYPVAAKQIDTTEKLLSWILWLCFKAWFTTGHLRALLEYASSRNVGLHIDMPK